MACYNGLVIDAAKNLYLGSDMDVCDICINEEMAKNENKGKAFYEIRLALQGKVRGKKLARIRNSANTVTIICEDCIKNLCKNLIVEETPQPEDETEMAAQTEIETNDQTVAEEAVVQKKRGPKPKQR